MSCGGGLFRRFSFAQSSRIAGIDEELLVLGAAGLDDLLHFLIGDHRLLVACVVGTEASFSAVPTEEEDKDVTLSGLVACLAQLCEDVVVGGLCTKQQGDVLGMCLVEFSDGCRIHLRFLQVADMLIVADADREHIDGARLC